VSAMVDETVSVEVVKNVDVLNCTRLTCVRETCRSVEAGRKRWVG